MASRAQAGPSWLFIAVLISVLATQSPLASSAYVQRPELGPLRVPLRIVIVYNEVALESLYARLRLGQPSGGGVREDRVSEALSTVFGAQRRLKCRNGETALGLAIKHEVTAVRTAAGSTGPWMSLTTLLEGARAASNGTIVEVDADRFEAALSEGLDSVGSSQSEESPFTLVIGDLKLINTTAPTEADTDYCYRFAPVSAPSVAYVSWSGRAAFADLRARGCGRAYLPGNPDASRIPNFALPLTARASAIAAWAHAAAFSFAAPDMSSCGDQQATRPPTHVHVRLVNVGDRSGPFSLESLVSRQDMERLISSLLPSGLSSSVTMESVPVESTPLEEEALAAAGSTLQIDPSSAYHMLRNSAACGDANRNLVRKKTYCIFFLEADQLQNALLDGNRGCAVFREGAVILARTAAGDVSPILEPRIEIDGVTMPLTPADPRTVLMRVCLEAVGNVILPHQASGGSSAFVSATLYRNLSIEIGDRWQRASRLAHAVRVMDAAERIVSTFEQEVANFFGGSGYEQRLRVLALNFTDFTREAPDSASKGDLYDRAVSFWEAARFLLEQARVTKQESVSESRGAALCPDCGYRLRSEATSTRANAFRTALELFLACVVLASSLYLAQLILASLMKTRDRRREQQQAGISPKASQERTARAVPGVRRPTVRLRSTESKASDISAR